MKDKTRLAVFASGTGSNYDAIDQAIKQGTLDAEVVMIVCDRPGAQVIEKADQNKVATFVFDPKDYQTKVDFETEIAQQLREVKVDWVILAGYMRLVGPTLLAAYHGRMVNIHPSLLPAFPGLDAIGQALHAGVKVSGVTIHYVDQGMDTGKIIAQQPVKIEEDMTREVLQRKIQDVEHMLYPKTIQQLIKEGE
ncbi:phosphoribosylglycinamide formyltransferase [Amphibacillus cookii]|uniref:phosphoribosylglycinamide formyltransferase n=1 Tax=Amphibacillus cookii TaxID=767787 RepID=UPI00195B5211|nr:phosphoribosylglycinamide formyltransferase [Amphibacillus cookii]MBM7542189.1 phosphoribosylglycinamide formyltransferase-1 [Amphibacillus cookii]